MTWTVFSPPPRISLPIATSPTDSPPHPGTYWAHPHVGLEADYGLYLPVIIDDPAEPANYDAEWIVVLDDWTDGISKSPQQIYDALKANPCLPRCPAWVRCPE